MSQFVKLPDTEEKPILVFLGLNADGSTARIANRAAVGDDGIASLRNAEVAGQFNAVKIRGGVNLMTLKQLDERITSLSGKGFDYSIAELKKAKEALQQGNVTVAQAKPALPVAVGG